jgi:hypothetical protein
VEGINDTLKVGWMNKRSIPKGNDGHPKMDIRQLAAPQVHGGYDTVHVKFVIRDTLLWCQTGFINL